MSLQVAKEFKCGNKKIVIYYDPEPINPLTEYDNLLEIYHWHNRYNFGKERGREPLTREELETMLKESGEEVLAILPLYMYDHSGITVSTTPYGCRWDSGQVGWVYATKTQAEKMGCIGEGWDKARYEEALRADVKCFDDYLNGNCYGYEVFGRDGEVLDSCWGYLGDMEHCEQEAKSAAGVEDPADVRDAEFLASRVTYASVV